MSHITTVSGAVFIPKKNLFYLLKAVENFCPGCELVQGQTHYRTWKDNHNGRLVGDWPLPKGWTAAQIGEGAHHAIRVTDETMAKSFKGKKRTDHGAPYEIGVVPVRVERDPKTGEVLSAVYDPNGEEYTLMTDWYANGNGILTQKGIGARHQGKNPQSGKQTEIAMGDLYMHYQMELHRAEAERLGDTINFQELPDGTYKAVSETQARLGVN